MKRFKGLLSVLLSVGIVLGCMPFAATAADAPTEDKVYTIFRPNFTKLGGSGIDVTASTSSLTSKSTVKTADEDGYYYYTFTQEYAKGDSIYSNPSLMKSGESNNSTGLNWIGKADVLEKLSGIVDFSADFRITQTGATVSRVTAYADGYDASASQKKTGWLNSPLTQFNDWNAVVNENTTLTNFYSGILGFEIDYPWNNEGKVPNDVTFKVDIRNIKLTLKESDRAAVNEALKDVEDWNFDKLIATYLDKEDEKVLGEDKVIYKANPTRVGTIGTEATVSIDQGSSKNPVYIASDGDGAYFTYTDEYENKDQWNRRHYFNMGYDNKYDGLSWTDSNKGVLGKLQGKVSVSLKLRITATATSGGAPTSGNVRFNFCYSGTNQVTKNALGCAEVKFTGEWIEAKFTPSEAVDSFYSGYAAIWAEPNVFNGTLKVDIKDIKMTVNTADKTAIDTALAGTDYSFDTLTATFADSGLENPDENSADTAVIWYANPDKITKENNGDVSAALQDDSNIKNYYTNKAYKAYDEDGVYYTTAIPIEGSGGDGASSTFKTGYEYTQSEGYGWLNNKDVLEALSPYIYLSTLYRVSGTAPSSGTAQLYINGTNGWSKEWGVGVPISQYGSWLQYSLKPTGMNLVNGWYETNISVNIYKLQGGLTGNYKVDIRDLRWELKAADRVYINKALSEIDGIDEIDNFTKDVTVATDVNGYKDYYSLITEPTVKANNVAFDVDDDGETTLIDLIRLKKYEAEIIYELGHVVFDRADSNADGYIDATDIVACRKKLLGF